VLALSDLTSSRSLVVGLLDYCEPEPPSSDGIAGRKVLEWGIAHVKTIRETGGALLGHRPIEAHGGLEELLSGRQLGDCSVWGFKVIEGYAHDYFGRHFPEHPAIATVRPSPHDDRLA
jgi:hypothetical protein